jgi:hypothetical protein
VGGECEGTERRAGTVFSRNLTAAAADRGSVACLVRPGAVLLALVTLSCGTPLSDAEALFEKGQYPASHEALLGLDVEHRSWDEPERAEYALYLGLTLLALGDGGEARMWLCEAKAVEDAHPGSLRYRDLRRLSVAIASNPVP